MESRDDRADDSWQVLAFVIRLWEQQLVELVEVCDAETLNEFITGLIEIRSTASKIKHQLVRESLSQDAK